MRAGSGLRLKFAKHCLSLPLSIDGDNKYRVTWSQNYPHSLQLSRFSNSHTGCTRREGSSTTLIRITTTTSSLGAPRIFSSLLHTFQQSAARTATANTLTYQSLLSCTVLHTSTRSYAKKKKMPPKKALKEEKILLGRPGNNLKSGIVCCSAHLPYATDC